MTLLNTLKQIHQRACAVPPIEYEAVHLWAEEIRLAAALAIDTAEATQPGEPSPGAQPTEQDMARAREIVTDCYQAVSKLYSEMPAEQKLWSNRALPDNSGEVREAQAAVILAALQRERRETAQRCVDIGPRLMFASPESKWEASCNDAFKIYASEIRRAEGLE